MITWTDRSDEAWEGQFTSSVFRNEDGGELAIYIEHFSIADYAQRCVDFINSMPDEMTDEICRGLIRCAEEDCENENFELPELAGCRDILGNIFFTEVYVSVPEDDGISFMLVGEGGWGEIAGVVVRNGRVVYIGKDCFDKFEDTGGNEPVAERAAAPEMPRAVHDNSYEEKPRIRFKKIWLVYLAAYIILVIIVIELGKM